MPNHTEKSLTYPLLAMLALIALSGAAQACAGTSGHNLAQVFKVVLQVLASFSAFVWYCRDSDARSYRRSLWRNILFNGVGVLFIPWYLVRTRARGKRLNALLRLGGVGMLTLVSLVVGAALGYILIHLV